MLRPRSRLGTSEWYYNVPMQDALLRFRPQFPSLDRLQAGVRMSLNFHTKDGELEVAVRAVEEILSARIAVAR